MLTSWFKTISEHKKVFIFSLLINTLILFLCKEQPYSLLWLAPAGLVGCYFLLFQFEWLFKVLLFTLPFAINDKVGNGLELSIPSEPIMIALSSFFVLILLFEKALPSQLIHNPITLLLLLNLIVLFTSACFSELPIISFKYFLARLWFVISGYFIALYVFNKSKENIIAYFAILTLSMSLIVSWITINHFIIGIDKFTSYYISAPFFKEHTIYGGVLGFFVPVSIYLAYNSKNKIHTIWWTYTSLLIFTAVLTSYTRAAWLGVLGSGFLFIVHFLKIKLRYVIVSGVIALGLVFTFQDLILMQLKKNSTTSSSSLNEHFTSISNTKSDPSNAERVNRWHCAVEMFKERPILGWGIGTYTYVYAPFQQSQYRTIISTNRGDVGNVHSEYLGPLSEMGLIGFLSVLSFYLMVVYISLRTFYKNNLPNSLKWLNIALLCGLYTYWIHGFMNNYLDIDKASFTFWFFIAGIAYLNYKSNALEESLSFARNEDFND